MITEIELPAGRASMSHRPAYLNESYLEAQRNGLSPIAAPVSGDSTAKIARLRADAELHTAAASVLEVPC